MCHTQIESASTNSTYNIKQTPEVVQICVEGRLDKGDTV